MNVTLAAHVSATETEDGGMVLLDRRSGRYWQLNPTGGVILRALLHEPSQTAAVDFLLRSIPRAPECIPDDVAALVQVLHERRLIAP
ncbi:lasso peptide biosynthesis PqqD family chaperone [Streptomyces sp. NPDC097640]|uniref:lasso peptide biosynthesis PqqD family chaperone n=1 Tax=Streptomyces sp. NPDC097640 TaxID=3157229 RepID=UPI0033173856